MYIKLNYSKYSCLPRKFGNGTESSKVKTRAVQYLCDIFKGLLIILPSWSTEACPGMNTNTPTLKMRENEKEHLYR